MTLFFYGGLEINDDKPEFTSWVVELANKLNWTIRLEQLQKEFSLDELFGAIPAQDLLVFELEYKDDEVDTQLYNDYGGELMLHQYRSVAKKLNFPSAEGLDFGSVEQVDKLYQAQPPELPIIVFIKKLIEDYPKKAFILCFAQDFENSSQCREVVGKKEELLREAWLTIAYGYSWPHLRLKYFP